MTGSLRPDRKGRRPDAGRRAGAGPAAAVLLAALALLAAWSLRPAPAAADPDYGGPVLTGLDPLLRGTTDERLLGPRRQLLREQLLAQGVDPRLAAGGPDLASLWRARADARSQVDLEREVTVVEMDGFRGLTTTFRYPEWFFLFPAAVTLPGGFVYYPPRPVTADEVDLFVDSLPAAEARRLAVDRVAARAALLDVARTHGGVQPEEGLLNLTIPIKLPRTLEKIIGRGEKTNIRITGREHISISGESTVTNKFIPTERVQSQSLFPTLDMQQELQLNLSGQIGEKIQIEVDHNSQVIGPEGTKIRLAYRGDEDEIIQTIETGDVGLTLPGSQLLGYASNKSGLFGIKTTGQVGRLDFTIVASKQKAESAAKSFNSRGGEVGEHIIPAYQYIANRFFRLDLPPGGGTRLVDIPGRPINGQIDQQSIQIYRSVPNRSQPTGSDISFVAAFVDTAGTWERGGPRFDAQGSYSAADVWAPIEDWSALLDQDGNVVAVDLGRSYDWEDELAVVYDVVDPTQTDAEGNPQLLYSVGDRPGRDEDQRILIQEQAYYRMKLLKPRWSQGDAHTWEYALRNIYSLGGSNIDYESFDLRIEYTDPRFADQPALVPNGDTFTDVPWIRVFGLDRDNQQRTGTPDDQVDKDDEFLFDLQRGLLKFPVDFDRPFAADREQYLANADTLASFWDATPLAQEGVLTPEIYEFGTSPQNYSQYSRFRIVAQHASASSSFNLGTMNIEEGSESVTLDGRTLTRGSDYDIDYAFGEITLKGEAAAGLTATSQVSVNYQYAPFLGGGKSSLLGVNLGWDLGRESKLSTTWLYQSSQIAGHKAKLGEEPSRNLVGNLNLQHTFKPYFLTHVANFVSRRDSERESSLQVSAEAAMSIPDPNTRGKVYLEDFEGVDTGNLLPMTRLGWYWASAPAQGRDAAYVAETGDGRQFRPEDRVPVIRWFTPKDPVPRRFLNPDLVEQERKENQQALALYMRAGEGGWGPDSWGGIMRGLGRIGVDLSKSQFLEFWVNDFAPDPGQRRGTLHIDFGSINEDFYWPRRQDGTLEKGTEQQEDNGDNVFTTEEDIGLDGVAGGNDVYGADFNSYADPYPNINGTEENQREDGEDLDGDVFETGDGYFSVAIDLANDQPLVDVVQDYSGEDVDEMIRNGVAWRKYRIPLGDVLTVSPPGSGQRAQIHAVTHVRVWYEDATAARDTVQLQLSEFEFLGSRWERDGIRRTEDEKLLAPEDRVLYPDERFYLGEINNKEYPDSVYAPPFNVHEENRIAEKEQSLVLDVQNLESGHMVRASKVVSPRGDDYTLYERMSWWWHNDDHRLADVDLFFRVGSDTANYYEVRYKYNESPAQRRGWKHMQINLAELSNIKFGTPDPETGVISGEIADTESGDRYRVAVVGRPDLRRVRNYYFGLSNDTGLPVTGIFYLNDILLEGVKRERGLAERLALRLNMADVLKVDFDWSQQDADFHGLNADRGRGFSDEDWNLTTSFRVDDFIPLLGFRMPVNLGRRQTIQRPKYMTNSDIELIDPDIRNLQSTIDTRESFSVRLMHEPSRAALLRYLIDPWNLSLNGSRSRKDAPLERARQKNLQGSVTYDLRIAGNHTLGAYPLLGSLPVLKGLSLVPSKLTMSASFNSSERTAEALALDGSVTPRPANLNRQGTLSGQLEYRPLPLATINANVRSERDLLRERILWGVNIGEENRFAQDLRLTLAPPRAAMLPSGALAAPARMLFRAVNDLQPSVTFNGSFIDDHGPNVRRADDPEGVRNVTASGDWQVRVRVPVGDWTEDVFPRHEESDQDRQEMIERERARERRERMRGRSRRPEPPAPGGPAPDQPAGGEGTADQAQPPEPPDGGQGLSAAERQQLENEQLLEAARRRREEEERERQRRAAAGQEAGQAEPPAPAAPAEQPGEGTGERPQESWDQDVGEGGGGFRIPNPLSPLLGLLRNTSPVQVSLSKREAGSYSRLLKMPPFWYRVGLDSRLDFPDSLYVTSSLTDRQSLQVSSEVRLTSKINVSGNFNETTGSQETAGRLTQSYQRDWPDLRLSVGGIERWGIFGGGEDREGWFTSSSIDVTYKRSLLVSGYTASIYNPRTTTSISPRWNFNFANGLSASLNVGHNRDVAISGGVRTTTKRLSVGLQLRHSFRAERLLARLGLYKPGSSPMVNMDVDINYSRDSTERLRPGQELADAPTGATRLSVNPRFTYQINRNLSGGLRLMYSRNKIIETDTIRQSFGLGLEATLVF